jgi:hypothetical protein
MAKKYGYWGRDSYPELVDRQEPMISPDDIMSDEDKALGAYFIEEYRMRVAEMSDQIAEWEAMDKMYNCERDRVSSDPSYPCSFVALVTPVIEGQVASIIEANIEFTCTSRQPGQEGFMKMLDAGGSYVRERNMFLQTFKDFGRTYDLKGSAIVSARWEKEAKTSKVRPNGYPVITTPDIENIIIDGKIKDYKNLQQAEYIIERMGVHSIGWARMEYGDEVADAIATGVEMDDTETSIDHNNAFVLLHVWTRKNKYHNLQLIEMDANGFVLRKSDPRKPYYTKTYNQYPYYMARMIPKAGSIYGIGDGKLLENAQDTVNKLTDELTIAAKFSAQGKWVVDPRSKANIKQINSDPSKPMLAENPNQSIRVIQPAGISPVVFQYIEFLLREAQRMVRFHDIMTGNMHTASATATQINNQIAQGSVGINDKKTDISHAMAWAYRYCLQLCLQYWTIPMWSFTSEGDTEWVDFKSIQQVPYPIPVSPEKANDMASKGLSPQGYEFVTKGEGKKKSRVMAELDFNVKVTIGQGIPKDRVSLFNMVISLLQLPVTDEEGNTKPLIEYGKAREMLEQILGFKLESQDQAIQGLRATMGLEPFGTHPMQRQPVNPATATNVQMPQGSQQAPLAENLAGSVVGTGRTDTRRAL